ncbi:hypothetical protein GCM10023350_52480 [Nocardioides endophyticus]|uniref:DUF4913 domain-containing protein n=1 Tax=Nocardioides endophyticus TaxID=1353775 RepID=A0ABP8ZM81_9ACTN
MEQFEVEPGDGYGGVPGLLEPPPPPINWNLLRADEAESEWRDLDMWVRWLKTTFGLPPTIVPPFWHRHDELVWELSALHTHFLNCYDETASPSAPIGWMRDFADARHRLRDWVAICGTRLDRDRPTRQTPWPGEPATESTGTAGEIEIRDRAADFESFVRADVDERREAEAGLCHAAPT